MDVLDAICWSCDHWLPDRTSNCVCVKEMPGAGNVTECVAFQYCPGSDREERNVSEQNEA